MQKHTGTFLYLKVSISFYQLKHYTGRNIFKFASRKKVFIKDKNSFTNSLNRLILQAIKLKKYVKAWKTYP